MKHMTAGICLLALAVAGIGCAAQAAREDQNKNAAAPSSVLAADAAVETLRGTPARFQYEIELDGGGTLIFDARVRAPALTEIKRRRALAARLDAQRVMQGMLHDYSTYPDKVSEGISSFGRALWVSIQSPDSLPIAITSQTHSFPVGRGNLLIGAQAPGQPYSMRDAEEAAVKAVQSSRLPARMELGCITACAPYPQSAAKPDAREPYPAGYYAARFYQRLDGGFLEGATARAAQFSDESGTPLQIDPRALAGITVVTDGREIQQAVGAVYTFSDEERLKDILGLQDAAQRLQADGKELSRLLAAPGGTQSGWICKDIRFTYVLDKPGTAPVSSLYGQGLAVVPVWDFALYAPWERGMPIHIYVDAADGTVHLPKEGFPLPLIRAGGIPTDEKGKKGGHL